ncbi:MAG TPA: hypothetical protein VJ649_00720 [Actinomycetes bacterium]|nr:hypothetical protein [Actinomycetes bacterium]
MFVQVIQGSVSDPAQVRETLETWVRDLSRDATGWLGTTAGVTDDGRFISVVRFQDEDAARANSNRPEQDAWWSRAAQLFDGEATFSDSNNVIVDLQGDPENAGFVQIIQGRSSDPDRSWELMSEDSSDWAAYRPDILGSVGASHEGGAYTMALYFTTEAEAREGEKKPPPPELSQQMEEMQKLEVGEPTFFDLKEPWLYTPR